MTETGHKAAPPTPLAAYVAVALISAVLGFGGVYAILDPADKSGPAGSGSAPLSQAAAATGDMARFVVRKPREAIPELIFQDGNGQPRTLADFKGKVILLNLWATWCAPCRIEMPSLDRLHQRLGGPRFEVIALSLDKGGAPVARAFLDGIKVSRLVLAADPTARAFATLKVTGLPTTLLIDPEGREIGRLAGPAEWDGPDAVSLIEAHSR